VSAPVPRFGGRVLLVEDNPVNQAVAERMLQRVGLQVTLAVDGRSAVDATRDQRFDLVLMDVQMPIMDGLHATRAIRAVQTPLGLRTPIVALTANAMAQEREQCLAAGMDDFLPKPFSSVQLHEVLARWLEPRTGATGGEALTAPGAARPPGALAAPLEPARFDSVQVLDQTALQRIRELGSRDRPDLLANVVRLFLHDAPRHLSAIQQAWQRRDAPAMAASAHVLKSASGYTGAMRLSAMCAALETDARAGELGRAEAVVASLEAEWRALRQQLDAAMGSVTTTSG
jgi:CheY-like chemotaxis protein/HPt (histidine-containing phosphotransfer) domain-containing protein